MRILLAFLLPAAVLAGNASLGGIVVNDSTGKPVHMALVTLSTTDAKPIEASVYTDADGAFQFNDVPPGRYYLNAGEFRYQHAFYGAPTPDRYPAILTLGAGEIRQGLELRMRPLGAISGLVLDQDGDPLPRVSVQLMVSSWVRGHKTWVQRNGAVSNERGEFRIFGIPAGQYVIAAMARGSQTIATRSQVNIGEPEPDLVFGRTYYPNGTRIEDARPVQLKPGADLRDIVLQMTTTPAASVTGRVEMPDGLDESTGVHVSLIPREGRGSPSAVAGGTRFAFPNLPPGRYEAVAVLNGNDAYIGREEVDLHPGPQELVLPLEKGTRLAGHVSVEGRPADGATQYEVTLLPGDGMPVRRNRFSATVGPDGSFSFDAVTRGVWDIGIHPIPKGGYVKSMKLGDQDVLTEDMTITPSNSAPLNIVLSTRGGAVTGTVKMPDAAKANAGLEVSGQPPATVLLIPVGKFSQVESFRIERPTEEGGKYELRGITPGSYRIFAFDHLARYEVQDPDFLARIEPLGRPVEVHEGEQIGLDLDLLPAPPTVAEAGAEP